MRVVTVCVYTLVPLYVIVDIVMLFLLFDKTILDLCLYSYVWHMRLPILLV